MNLKEIFKKMEQQRKKLEVLPTGFPTLDEVLDGGFFKKELVVLGGFTGSGKSFLASQLSLNLLQKGFNVSYFSLELSTETLISRMLGSLSGLKPSRVWGGWLTEDELLKKNEAIATLSIYEDNLSIFDDIYSLDEILKRIKADRPDFVVVDFIQNVITSGDEYERMSRVSLEFQKAAKTTNCCILVLSQLSNRAAREGGEAPTIEFKGAGTIAQVADLGFLLLPQQERKFTLALRKNRRGISRVSFNLKFNFPGGAINECEE